MKKPLRRVVLGGALWLGLASAMAGDFQRAFDAALAHDPIHRAARQELAAAAQNIPMARAGLLPNLSLSVSDAKVTGSRTAENFLGQPVTQPLNYRSPQQVLSMRAPLLNKEATQRYRQAQVQLEYAQSVFRTRTHELLDRLGQAYLQRQFAEHGLELARTQQAGMLEQRQLAVRRFALGDGTRPEVHVAEADLALAGVQVAEAQNQLAAATLALEQITGMAPAAARLPAEWPAPIALEPDNLAHWTQLAEAANPALAARRHAVELARLGVERADAGHYPRVDLVASVSKGRNDSVSTLNQAISQRSLGLQLNLPLYSGGFVEASVVQAMAEQEKAQAELDAEQLRVVADLSRVFQVVATGASRLAAQQQALDASRLVREGARRSVEGGVAITADVVRADVRVMEATRELAKARYEQLLARMRLYSGAGVAPEQIAQTIDGLLSPPIASAR